MLKLDYSHYMESESSVARGYYSIIAERLYAGLIAEPGLEEIEIDELELIPARQHSLGQRQKPNRQHHRRHESGIMSEDRPVRRRADHSRELIPT